MSTWQDPHSSSSIFLPCPIATSAFHPTTPPCPPSQQHTPVQLHAFSFNSTNNFSDPISIAIVGGTGLSSLPSPHHAMGPPLLSHLHPLLPPLRSILQTNSRRLPSAPRTAPSIRPARSTLPRQRRLPAEIGRPMRGWVQRGGQPERGGKAEGLCGSGWVGGLDERGT